MDRATKYEAALRNLAGILIRSATANSYDDKLETEKTAFFWYAAGRRDELIANPEVTLEEYDEVLSIDPDVIFDEVAYKRKEV